MDRRAALSLAAVVGLSAGAASLVYVLRNKEKVKYSLRCLVEGEPYEVRVARQTLGNAAMVVLETREEVEVSPVSQPSSTAQPMTPAYQTIRQRCGVNTNTLAVHVIDTSEADQEIKAAKKCNIALEHLLSREIDAVQV